MQVEDGVGGVLDFDTEEGVQEAIFEEVHRKQYNLADDAPICTGALQGQFGYSATSPLYNPLDGMYNFSPDIDEATKELFVEIAQIRSVVPPNSVTGIISRECW